ncbi:unnamed protein product [Amoebophrya sp. A25]|nr:unnamed protein product [Amoebophrya sp. A25]|eukprot:GSA25T00011726001.1
MTIMFSDNFIPGTPRRRSLLAQQNNPFGNRFDMNERARLGGPQYGELYSALAPYGGIASSPAAAGNAPPFPDQRSAMMYASSGAGHPFGLQSFPPLSAPRFALGSLGIAQNNMMQPYDPLNPMGVVPMGGPAGNGMLATPRGGTMMGGVPQPQMLMHQPTYGLQNQNGIQQLQSVWGQQSRFGQALVAAALTQRDMEEREQVALEIHQLRLNRLEDVIDVLAVESGNVVQDHEMRLRKIEGFLSAEVTKMVTDQQNSLDTRAVTAKQNLPPSTALIPTAALPLGTGK